MYIFNNKLDIKKIFAFGRTNNPLSCEYTPIAINFYSYYNKKIFNLSHFWRFKIIYFKRFLNSEDLVTLILQ